MGLSGTPIEVLGPCDGKGRVLVGEDERHLKPKPMKKRQEVEDEMVRNERIGQWDRSEREYWDEMRHQDEEEGRNEEEQNERRRRCERWWWAERIGLGETAGQVKGKRQRTTVVERLRGTISQMIIRDHDKVTYRAEQEGAGDRLVVQGEDLLRSPSTMLCRTRWVLAQALMEKIVSCAHNLEKVE